MNAGFTKDKGAVSADVKSSGADQVILDREEVLRSRKKYWRLRRAQDIILSILALIVLSPVFLMN